jgi:hypothetical protein
LEERTQGYKSNYTVKAQEQVILKESEAF